MGQTGTGSTDAAQDAYPGVGKQTTVPSATHPTSIPGSGAEKVTDASRLVAAPPTGQNNTMVLPQLPEHQPAAVVLGLSKRPEVAVKCFSNSRFVNRKPLCA